MKKPDYSIIKLLEIADFSDKEIKGRFVSDRYPYHIKLVGRSKNSKHPGKYTKIVILDPSEPLKAKSRTHLATFDIPSKKVEAKTVLRVLAGIEIRQNIK